MWLCKYYWKHVYLLHMGSARKHPFVMATQLWSVRWYVDWFYRYLKHNLILASNDLSMIYICMSINDIISQNTMCRSHIMSSKNVSIIMKWWHIYASKWDAICVSYWATSYFTFRDLHLQLVATNCFFLKDISKQF